MKQIILSAAALLLASTSFPANAKVAQWCHLEKAVYQAADGSGLTLRMHKSKAFPMAVSPYILEIFGGQLKGKWWYYFDEGALERITLISTTDPSTANWQPSPDGGDRPHGAASLIGVNEQGVIWSSAPNSSTKPVKFLIIPELGEALKRFASSVSYKPSAFVFSRCIA